MIKKIGFIGLGVLGKPMARNLINSGYQLTGYDINCEAVDRLATDGAEAASSLKGADASVDVVITILPDDRIVQETVTGKDGAMEGMPEGAILVDMSSIFFQP